VLLNHHGGEALHIHRLQTGVGIGDQITGTPDAEGDRLALHVPGGGADIAVVNPPGEPFGQHVVGKEGEAERFGVGLGKGTGKGMNQGCGGHGDGGERVDGTEARRRAGAAPAEVIRLGQRIGALRVAKP
jgi:hypothetical protein